MNDGSFFGFCITVLVASALILAWLSFFITIFRQLWQIRIFITVCAILYFGAKLLKMI